VHAATFPFTGTLEIVTSTGTVPESFELVSLAVSGQTSLVASS
jgi:hypothetical protein